MAALSQTLRHLGESVRRGHLEADRVLRVVTLTDLQAVAALVHAERQ